MILYDLRCAAGHLFEAWFPSSEAYAEQEARGLIECPACGSREVSKAVMAPAIARGAARDPAGDLAEARQMLRALARLQAEIAAHFVDVGDRFPEEARRLHALALAGETDDAPPGIRGQATAAEAQQLLEEGIPVVPLPGARRHDA